jgi:hypothetical protein
MSMGRSRRMFLLTDGRTGWEGVNAWSRTGCMGTYDNTRVKSFFQEFGKLGVVADTRSRLLIALMRTMVDDLGLAGFDLILGEATMNAADEERAGVGVDFLDGQVCDGRNVPVVGHVCVV